MTGKRISEHVSLLGFEVEVEAEFGDTTREITDGPFLVKSDDYIAHMVGCELFKKLPEELGEREEQAVRSVVSALENLATLHTFTATAREQAWQNWQFKGCP